MKKKKLLKRIEALEQELAVVKASMPVQYPWNPAPSPWWGVNTNTPHFDTVSVPHITFDPNTMSNVSFTGTSVDLMSH